MRAVLLGLIASLAACSLLSPSPPDLTYKYASAWAMQNCTLNKMQNRRELPIRIPSSGTAYAFIIRTQPVGPTNRAVTGAHAIYLQMPNEPAAFIGILRDPGGQEGHVVVEHDKQIKSAQAWTVTEFNALGGRRPKNAELRNGATIRLQPAGSREFVRFDQGGDAKPKSAIKSSRAGLATGK